MSTDFLYDVFLSHSSKDKTVVRPLAERLRVDGLKVWFDKWEIRPGDSIPAKRLKQIMFEGERFDVMNVRRCEGDLLPERK